MTDQASKIASTIIAHLKSQDRLDLLGAVVGILKSSEAYKNSQNRVVITSAVALDTTEVKQITLYLKSSIGTDYELVKAIDPSLVAGFTLQVNDTFIDASVLGKINKVQNTLTAKE
jgi:F0F1-type ATP synthase delta subunit